MKSKKVLSSFMATALMLPGVALAANEVSRGLSLFSGMFGTGLAAERTLPQLIVDIVQLLLLFAGAIAVLFIIIGGFWYITSAGNEETAEKGRKTLINAIIGVIVIIMSYAIISVIQNTVAGY